jgi:hypothetical protein
MSSRQSGGNFKGSKHQRSKPKKLETPKQDGGWLEWLVPPLAIAKLAKQKKAKRRRAMRRRAEMRDREMISRGEMNTPRYGRRNYWGRNYSPKPRTSRNFYINVSNNSSRNNSKQQNNSQQLKPAQNQLKPPTNPNRPWVNRRQKGGGWWPDWIAPKPTKIIHSYNKGVLDPSGKKGAGKRKIRAGKRNYTKQKGGIVADERKLARRAARDKIIFNGQYRYPLDTQHSFGHPIRR